MDEYYSLVQKIFIVESLDVSTQLNYVLRKFTMKSVCMSHQMCVKYIHTLMDQIISKYWSVLALTEYLARYKYLLNCAYLQSCLYLSDQLFIHSSIWHFFQCTHIITDKSDLKYVPENVSFIKSPATMPHHFGDKNFRLNNIFIQDNCLSFLYNLYI